MLSFCCITTAPCKNKEKKTGFNPNIEESYEKLKSRPPVISCLNQRYSDYCPILIYSV